MQACIFVPVQMLNYRYSPPHLRVPVVLAAGMVFVSLLSFFRGKTEQETVERITAINHHDNKERQ